MRNFFLMGCGGSKFTVDEDELGLPCKKDSTRRKEEMHTKGENETLLIDDSSMKESHQGNENKNGLKEIPTYEVKCVNNQLVQQVTMTSVNVKNSTTTRKDSDYDVEDGSLMSNYKDDALIGSPSFREYCHNDSNSQDSHAKEIDHEKVGVDDNNKTQTTKTETAISHELDDTSNNKKTITKNDTTTPPHENEHSRNGSTSKERRGLTLRKVFPIHMMHIVKRTTTHRRSDAPTINRRDTQ